MKAQPMTMQERWKMLDIINNELSEMQFNISHNPNTTTESVVTDLRQLADWIEAGMPAQESETGS